LGLAPTRCVGLAPPCRLGLGSAMGLAPRLGLARWMASLVATKVRSFERKGRSARTATVAWEDPGSARGRWTPPMPAAARPAVEPSRARSWASRAVGRAARDAGRCGRPNLQLAAHRHGVSKAITSERGRVRSAKPTQFPKSSKPPPLRLKSVHCEIIIFSNLKNMAQK